MALWILAAMVIVFAVPALVGAGAGRWLGRRNGRVRAGASLGFFVGSVIGFGLVIATFFEGLFTPRIELELPPGFAHDKVFLIPDRSSEAALDLRWIAPVAQVQVPTSGVVRLRDLDELEGPFEVSLSDGSRVTEWGGGETPTALGHGPMVTVFLRPRPLSDIRLVTDQELVDEIRALERGR